jgi:hypothetical protein
MRWVGHVARVRERRCIQVFGGAPQGKYYLQDLDVDGKITLKCMLKGMKGCSLD